MAHNEAQETIKCTFMSAVHLNMFESSQTSWISGSAVFSRCTSLYSLKSLALDAYFKSIDSILKVLNRDLALDILIV